MSQLGRQTPLGQMPMDVSKDHYHHMMDKEMLTSQMKFMLHDKLQVRLLG